MNRFVLRQSLLLFLTATIWGIAFVAQSVGMDYVGPFTFGAVRCTIGGLVLLPCIAILSYYKKKTQRKENGERETQLSAVDSREKNRQVFLGGICCGVILFVASTLQQFGLMYTSVGKSGFVTAMYIIIVPILGIFVRKKVGRKIWFGVGLAVVGLYLLCMSQGNLALEKGDVLTLGCAIVFSFHILVVDYFSPKVDGVKMSCIQFFVCAGLSAIGMFLLESPSVSQIMAAWVPILYAGVLSCGVAYTLQIIGQKGMNPTVASLIMSMESVISVLAGWIILHQTLTVREMFGCLLMFAAIVLVQLPERKKDIIIEETA